MLTRDSHFKASLKRDKSSGSMEGCKRDKLVENSQGGNMGGWKRDENGQK